MALAASVALSLLAAGCGADVSLRSGEGLTQDEVCERFLPVVGQAMRVEVENGREVSSPQAVQHRDFAEQAAEFGRWAQAAEDEGLAERAANIADEADRVLEEMPADASDERAQEIAEGLYAETGSLYMTCVAEAYRRVLAGEVELTGACAEPGAPKLEGPNVVVYPSGGNYVDSTCELVEGEVVDDGCVFPGWSRTGEAGETGAWGRVEVAHDPDTCRTLYESGRLRD